MNSVKNNIEIAEEIIMDKVPSVGFGKQTDTMLYKASVHAQIALASALSDLAAELGKIALILETGRHK